MGDHWYNSFGEPCYGTGLRDARLLKLLPSVTSIDKVIANTGLDIWKQNIVIESCIANPFDGSCDDKEYIDWIKKEAFRDSRQKMKLGTVVHHMAERYIKGKPLFFQGARSDVWEIFKPLKDWIDINLMAPDTGLTSNEGAEVILVNEELGYAGKADFKGRITTSQKVILDFKTTTVKPSDIKKDGALRKAKLYDSYVRQLTALDMATPPKEVNILMSVIISTNPECYGVWTHIWSNADIGKAWVEFTGALQIYRSIKKL